MCGRFVNTKSPRELARILNADEIKTQEEHGQKQFNIAPSEDIWLAHSDKEGQEILTRYHWGLIPYWAKEAGIGYKMINTRADSLDKSAYQRTFQTRRCLIPADGFYEWKKEGKEKLPYYFTLNTGDQMCFAGLWEIWKDKESGEFIRSCTIITTEPNGVVKPIHDRMPVVLPITTWDRWLDLNNKNLDELKSLLVPAPDEVFDCWPVSKKVNSAKEDDPSFVEPIEA